MFTITAPDLVEQVRATGRTVLVLDTEHWRHHHLDVAPPLGVAVGADGYWEGPEVISGLNISLHGDVLYCRWWSTYQVVCEDCGQGMSVFTDEDWHAPDAPCPDVERARDAILDATETSTPA